MVPKKSHDKPLNMNKMKRYSGRQIPDSPWFSTAVAACPIRIADIFELAT
jgi:hypothetical protein